MIWNEVRVLVASFATVSWAMTSWTVAVAQGVEGGGASQQPSALEQFMPFILIFIVFFFFIIRPQQKRAKAHKDFLLQMKRGDSVLTSSGIFGTIAGLTEKFVTLEVADGVQLRILKAQIASPGSVKEEK